METISITVRLFASLQDVVGADRVTLTVPLSTPLGAVWGHLPQLAKEHPPTGLRYAVNHEWTSPAATLRDGDEVALILPVSGG